MITRVLSWSGVLRALLLICALGVLLVLGLALQSGGNMSSSHERQRFDQRGNSSLISGTEVASGGDISLASNLRVFRRSPTVSDALPEGLKDQLLQARPTLPTSRSESSGDRPVLEDSRLAITAADGGASVYLIPTIRKWVICLVPDVGEMRVGSLVKQTLAWNLHRDLARGGGIVFGITGNNIEMVRIVVSQNGESRTLDATTRENAFVTVMTTEELPASGRVVHIIAVDSNGREVTLDVQGDE